MFGPHNIHNKKMCEVNKIIHIYHTMETWMNGFPAEKTSGMARVGAGEWVPAPQMLVGRLVGVSENSGTPKSSILIGFSIITHPFWVPLFLEIPLCWISCFTFCDEDVTTWRMDTPTLDTWLFKGLVKLLQAFWTRLTKLKGFIIRILAMVISTRKKAWVALIFFRWDFELIWLNGAALTWGDLVSGIAKNTLERFSSLQVDDKKCYYV